ncbi:MAG: nucleoside-diphosphate sugar epimerase/dehydratase [Ilumatobacteraceae bacterium]
MGVGKMTARRVWTRLASRTVRMRSDLPVVLFDIVLTALAYVAMMVLRFDGSVPDHFWSSFGTFLPIAILIALLSNWAFGLYGQLWRHASLFEAHRLLTSSAVTILALLAIQLVDHEIPISVVVTGAALSGFLMTMLRFQSRLFSFRRRGQEPGFRVVVIGAGDAGASLVADMVRSPRAGFRPVAVLDDDPKYHGRSFMGIGVLGGIETLPAVVESTGAHLAVFAMTNAPQETVRRAASAAEAADVAMKIVPGIGTSMRGGASLRDLRDLRIDDLLGREQITTDLDAVTAMLVGRCVLITGAGGSIGSEIVRQVIDCDPAKVVLVDHDETHLYDVAAMCEGPVVQVLADIRNARQMRAIFDLHRPNVVFHAAAHKHVPLLEAHPTEAVHTNVIGTGNIVDCALAVGVERLVLISTDKAVYPSSVMGASKRICEQLLIARAPDGSAFCAVRFGNVLGSRGSVVPTFMRQIEAGGPVTVTDRRMTRFFMSIREAVQLVLQAAALADPESHGEIFMLDMGEPVVIHDLAERMIRLSGRKPGSDVEIRIVGTRPGEKLTEELMALDEHESATAHPSIRRVTPIQIDPELLQSGLAQLHAAALDLDNDAASLLLHELAGDGGLPKSTPPVYMAV